MLDREQGTKYQETRHLDIKEIAKLVRMELKIRFGLDYPKAKIQVWIERYSMGQTLHIVFRDMGFYDYSENGKELGKHIIEVAEAYNYHERDYMDDYHATKFWVAVRIVK